MQTTNEKGGLILMEVMCIKTKPQERAMKLTLISNS